MDIILIFIFSLIIILLYLFLTYFLTDNEYFGSMKPYLWIYWENKPGKSMPDYISLCRKTILKHAKDSFTIVELNEKNIYDYLPELKEKEQQLDLNNLIIAQKVDYYRILLLYKYGGLYMDADIILLQDPIEIIQKLNDYDFVGFGCTGYVCNDGYGKPSNWVMASRANGKLISRVLNNMENKLNKANKQNSQWNYHDLGKLIIWDELQWLKTNENYKYYHYSSDYDGARDKNGYWVTDDRLFSSEDLQYKLPNEMLFIVLYNSGLHNIASTSASDLLSANTNFSKFIKKSLGNEYDR